MINEIVHQDEDGRVISRFPNPRAVDEALAVEAPDTHCLQYIDPYGDTVFNGRQVARLIDELRDRMPGQQTMLQHHTRQLIGFVQDAVDEIHTYVKFIGD